MARDYSQATTGSLAALDPACRLAGDPPKVATLWDAGGMRAATVNFANANRVPDTRPDLSGPTS